VGRVRTALAAHRPFCPGLRLARRPSVSFDLTGSGPVTRAACRPGRKRYPRRPCLQARGGSAAASTATTTLAGRRAKEPRCRRQRSGGRCRFRTRAATRPSLAPIAESGAGADVCRTGQLLLQSGPDALVPRPNWPARGAGFRVRGMLPNQAANSGGRRPRALVRPRQAYQQERHRLTRRTSRDRRP
jgi:hypothetical protein